MKTIFNIILILVSMCQNYALISVIFKIIYFFNSIPFVFTYYINDSVIRSLLFCISDVLANKSSLLFFFRFAAHSPKLLFAQL